MINKNIRCVWILLSIFLISECLLAQTQPSNANEIISGHQSRKALASSSPLKNISANDIGPQHQGGRVIDLAVSNQDAKTFYVAYASGGLFKTVNNGTTFQPIFDNQGALTIGDIALAPSNDQVLYLGTGESNSSRSSYSGNGVYKTTDGGKTWQHLGLDFIHHTGAVVVHPTNPETVWVGAIGALYSHNSERGVYKSTDGGKSWKKTLFINDSTGIIDLIVNPTNPNQLFAAAWERTRKAWNFKGSGPNSGIFVSNDGGETWSKSTQGFPEGKGVGRIGLDISAANPNVVYALLDNQEENKKEKKTEASSDLKQTDFITMSNEQFLLLDDAKLNKYLKDNRYPEKYTADVIKKDVKSGKYAVKAIGEYLGDANSALFETEVKGTEIYKSEDGGKSWKLAHDKALPNVYFTYGYYFGRIRVSPADENTLYVLGVPLLISEDGGKSYSRVDSIGDVHVDHQALWVNPKDPAHVMLGNDGGLYVSYDKGAYWNHVNNTSVGQFYTLSLDNEKPYNVYGGLQDNGSMRGSSVKNFDENGDGWKDIMGGDGMYIFSDPRNQDIIYTGFQFGNYYRVDLSKNDYKFITPSKNIGEPALRFNWRTPLVMSPHNPDIIYIAAQKVYRSVNAGQTWDAISGDLTMDKPQGNVPYSTISILEESKLKYGLLYVGTDDGNVHVSQNGGATWDLITKDLPKDMWVTSIQPSIHDEATVFLTMTGYRFDHFKPYVFKSTDYGKTWTSIVGNLPFEAVNVIHQDPLNSELLYLGSDHGSYVSFNGGKNWDLITQIPNVASYQMLVHPRENELIVATHGRSVYKVDVKPLQALKGDNINKGVLAFEPASIRYSANWGKQRTPFDRARDPKVSLSYYVGKEAAQVKVEVLNEKGDVIRILEGSGTKGFQKVLWDVKVNASLKPKKGEQPELVFAQKGKYKIRYTNGKETAEVAFEIK